MPWAWKARQWSSDGWWKVERWAEPSSLTWTHTRPVVEYPKILVLVWGRAHEQVQFLFLHYYSHPSLLSLSYILTEVQDHIYAYTLSWSATCFHDHAHMQSSHGSHVLSWTCMLSWLPGARSGLHTHVFSWPVMSPDIYSWSHTSTQSHHFTCPLAVYEGPWLDLTESAFT